MTDAHMTQQMIEENITRLQTTVARLHVQVRSLAALLFVALIGLAAMLVGARNLDHHVDRLGRDVGTVRVATDEIRTVVYFAEENNRILCELNPTANDCRDRGIDP